MSQIACSLLAHLGLRNRVLPPIRRLFVSLARLPSITSNPLKNHPGRSAFGSLGKSRAVPDPLSLVFQLPGAPILWRRDTSRGRLDHPNTCNVVTWQLFKTQTLAPSSRGVGGKSSTPSRTSVLSIRSRCWRRPMQERDGFMEQWEPIKGHASVNAMAILTSDAEQHQWAELEASSSPTIPNKTMLKAS
ncbi:hypothetical protein NM208_g13863 [Fusarium decemcellulare]|uniref:Uncharacterized protein n=1 Tax=Fusarium decemcellulare TaxID=57161 RepID=A0ACC1RLQ6_9HYPO|nr:hypothetical protein NM208_g13863 [Fusarium decemcellulare]